MKYLILFILLLSGCATINEVENQSQQVSYYEQYGDRLLIEINETGSHFRVWDNETKSYSEWLDVSSVVPESHLLYRKLSPDVPRSI